jgi:hypothetical protein
MACKEQRPSYILPLPSKYKSEILAIAPEVLSPVYEASLYGIKGWDWNLIY